MAKLSKDLNRLISERKRSKTLCKSILFDKAFGKAGFEYVVNKKPKPKVAFLSGQQRRTGQNEQTFSKIDCTILKTSENIGPGSYKPEKFDPSKSNKVVSNVGMGGLARTEPRFKGEQYSDTPGPDKYAFIQPKPLCTKDSAKYPFGSNIPRKQPFQVTSEAPGVCSYNIAQKDRSIQQEHSFGGRVKLKPVVEFKCVPYSTDICSVCSEKPIGDYWINKETKKYICGKCYFNNNMYMEKLHIPGIKKYNKVRDCSEVHEHQGTTATIPLISTQDVSSILNKEAYLDPYSSTILIKQIKPSSKRRKTIRKDIKIGAGPSNGLKNDLAKVIKSLYKHTDAEYLKKRNITAERMREIMTPTVLVPDRERLMQYLLAEQEVYPLKDYPKVRKKQKLHEENFEFEYKYTPIEYTIEDILIDKDLIDKFEKYKLMEFDEDKDKMEKEIEEQEDLEEEKLTSAKISLESETVSEKIITEDEVSLRMLEEVVSIPQPEENISLIKEEMPDIPSSTEIQSEESKELQAIYRQGITDNLMHGIKMIEILFVPTVVTPQDILASKPPLAVEESKEVEGIKRQTSELNLLQDPNIPPMPRVIAGDYGDLSRSEIDPEILSLLDKGDFEPSRNRSISTTTFGTRFDYPRLRPS